MPPLVLPLLVLFPSTSAVRYCWMLVCVSGGRLLQELGSVYGDALRCGDAYFGLLPLYCEECDSDLLADDNFFPDAAR